jgi:translation initiation factor 5A
MDVSDDNFCSLLDDEKNETRDDIKLPAGELGDQIKAKFDAEESIRVTVLKSMGEEAIMAFKIDNDSK